MAPSLELELRPSQAAAICALEQLAILPWASESWSARAWSILVTIKEVVRSREGKGCALGHTASYWLSRDVHALDSKAWGSHVAC